MIARPLLALDTATRVTAVALGSPDGTLVASSVRETGHRHAEGLLDDLDRLIRDAGARAEAIAGVAVGIGPGSFTGLRVGLATAKVLAYSLGVPIVGVPTSEALAHAAMDDGTDGGEVAVVLPAGAADLYLTIVAFDADGPRAVEAPRLVAPREAIDAAVDGRRAIAVDLADAVLDAAARDRGDAAVRALPASVLALGARRLREGRHDDVATLVPAYVALPRGVEKAAREVAWSPDLR